MEIIRDQNTLMYRIKNSHGPCPSELAGDWTSLDTAKKALEGFHSKVRSKVKDPQKRIKERYAADNQTSPA